MQRSQQTEYWETAVMLYCIKFPLQQAAPDWPTWAPENTIFSLLELWGQTCGSRGSRAIQAGTLAFGWVFHTPPGPLESSAVPAHTELPELPQEGCLQAGWRVSRHTLSLLISGSQHYQTILLHNLEGI